MPVCRYSATSRYSGSKNADCRCCTLTCPQGLQARVCLFGVVTLRGTLQRTLAALQLLALLPL